MLNFQGPISVCNKLHCKRSVCPLWFYNKLILYIWAHDFEESFFIEPIIFISVLWRAPLLFLSYFSQAAKKLFVNLTISNVPGLNLASQYLSHPFRGPWYHFAFKERVQ